MERASTKDCQVDLWVCLGVCLAYVHWYGVSQPNSGYIKEEKVSCTQEWTHSLCCWLGCVWSLHRAASDFLAMRLQPGPASQRKPFFLSGFCQNLYDSNGNKTKQPGWLFPTFSVPLCHIHHRDVHWSPLLDANQRPSDVVHLPFLWCTS